MTVIANKHDDASASDTFTRVSRNVGHDTSNTLFGLTNAQPLATLWYCPWQKLSILDGEVFITYVRSRGPEHAVSLLDCCLKLSLSSIEQLMHDSTPIFCYRTHEIWPRRHFPIS